MGNLKVLPANIANMIAAGEVVQRPSSVAKELLENAIDAGADKLTLVVKDSGRTLVQLIDNGCGMSPSDAVLCFERHATSKIASQEDLEKIMTYGFRGEALPSIASVAEVTLVSRRQSDELATKVTTGADGLSKGGSVQAPVGTNISVRNLFYNTPARRKFLKSDQVEFKHILEEFIRVAIPHPEIAMTLNHNGSDVYVLRPAKSLKFRLQDLFGQNMANDVADMSAETSVAKIYGFVGRPDAARKTSALQYFFVRGRFFKSAYLHKAVMKAYEELVPDGFSPSYFIFLDIDPQTIDVNVHPTKTEIKFEDESIMFQVLYACVREALGKNSFSASIDFNTEGMVDIPQLGESFEKFRGPVTSPAPAPDYSYDPFRPSDYVDHRDNYGAIFEDSSPVQTHQYLEIDGKYILTPTTSGLMVVNVRRAWERVLYERALKAMSKGENVSSATLFPETVRVGAGKRLILDANAELLKSLGFKLENLGTDSVVVNGMPDAFDSSNVSAIILEVADMLEEGTNSLPEVMKQNTAARFAAIASVSGASVSGTAAARSLVEALFSCDNAEFTPGGKKIATVISPDELEKRFQ